MTRLLLLAAATAVLLVGAPTAEAAEIPGFSSPVVDAADVVPVQVEQRLNAALGDYQRRSGNQIAVALVETTGNQSIEDYAIDLAREWGVGSEERDDGVVLLIAVADREVRIEVGQGLEGDLTDLVSGRILREHLLPRLREGDYAGAIEAGTVELRRALGDDLDAAPLPSVGPAEDPSPDGGFPVGLLVFGAFLLFSMLGGAGNRRRNRRWGMGGPIIWGGGFGGGRGGFGGGGFGGGGFGGGGGGGFGGGGASGRW